MTVTSRLFCLLIAVALAVPVSAIASLTPCCCEDEASEVTSVEADACCESSCTPDQETPESDGDSDGDTHRGCDCPSMCCSIAKTQLGVSNGDGAMCVAAPEETGGLESDRDAGANAVFEIAHPPKS